MEKKPIKKETKQNNIALADFAKIVTNRKSDHVVEQVYEAILRGDLQPQQRFSSERELAEAFGVSKLTIREAVRSLEQMGILEVRKGGHGGLFIREIDIINIVDQLKNVLRMPRISVHDITETRIALETYIMRYFLPTRKLSRKEIWILEHYISKAEKSLLKKKPFEQLKTDYDFHTVLALLTDNIMIIIFHRLICDMLMRFYALVDPTKELLSRNLNCHRQILEAIQKRDFEKAIEINIAHIREVTAIMTDKSKRKSSIPKGTQ